jgi:hypothetical protein
MSPESFPAEPTRAWGVLRAPIPKIQADTDHSDRSQRDKRQGICSIRTQTDPEHFMDHELDV